MTFEKEKGHEDNDFQLSTKQKINRFLKQYPIITLLPSIIVCLSLWWIPPPEGLTVDGMHLLAVFLSVIVALLVSSYSTSLIIGLCMIVLCLVGCVQCKFGGKSIPCHQCGKPIPDEPGKKYKCSALDSVLAGYSEKVVWLIFAAFQIGKAVELTQLGKRASLYVILFFGRGSMLGIGYAIFFSEFLLAPFIPSNTARGGGIILPIVGSISKMIGSEPGEKARKTGGEFLHLCGVHANMLTSALFLSAMPGNPFVQQEAQKSLNVDFSYMVWIKGSIVPGLACAILMPLLFKYLSPHNVNLKQLRSDIQSELASLGPMSANEIKLTFTLVVMLSLWIASDFTGLGTEVVALAGVFFLLYSNTIKWKDVLENKGAWDCFFWIAGFIMLGNQLGAMKVTSFIGDQVSILLKSASPLGATIGLAVIYFFLMYMFSSVTAHVIAFAGPFLNAGKSLGCPAYLLVALIAYTSSLCGSLTNYSCGPTVLYFSQGYIPQTRFFGFGLLVSFYFLAIFLTIGLGWWKILGWW